MAPPTRRASAQLSRTSLRMLGQSSPIPRWAVSMASATGSPHDHRWCRKASVASQSTTAGRPGVLSAYGAATTCAAANGRRDLNGCCGRLNAWALLCSRYTASEPSAVGRVSDGTADSVAERGQDVLGHQLELVEIARQRVQHQLLDAGVLGVLDLLLDLVDDPGEVARVDVVPRPLLADALTEPPLLLGPHVVGASGLRQPGEVL